MTLGPPPLTARKYEHAWAAPALAAAIRPIASRQSSNVVEYLDEGEH